MTVENHLCEADAVVVAPVVCVEKRRRRQRAQVPERWAEARGELPAKSQAFGIVPVPCGIQTSAGRWRLARWGSQLVYG